METLTCAAVAWKVHHNPTFDGWLAHFDALLAQGVAVGADLVVFPEFIDLERLAPGDSIKPLAESFSAWPDFLRERAAKHNVTIVGGSTFAMTDDGIVNRSVTAWPDGLTTYADKHVLTQFEIDDWQLQTCQVFEAERGLGTTVCYDCEFPASGRSLAEASAWIQAVPAFTETEHGFHRVRYACHARAVENQVFVVHASLVGELGYEPVPSTYGTAAIIAPSCAPFPADGVLAETRPGEEGIAVYRLDRAQLEEARTTGDVRNWHDRDKGDWRVSSSSRQP